MAKSMALDSVTKPADGRKLRLETLIRLRWLAVVGQALSIFIVAGVLQFSIPLAACIVLIVLLAAVNAWLQFTYPSTWRLDPSAHWPLEHETVFQARAPSYRSLVAVRTAGPTTPAGTTAPTPSAPAVPKSSA